MILLVNLFFLLVQLNCTHLKGNGNVVGHPEKDMRLFASVIAELELEYGEISVDPRPLKADPRIVTLTRFDLVPAHVSPSANTTPLADGDTAEIVKKRKSILDSMAIREIDIFASLKCPGKLVPPSDEVSQKREAFCPKSDLTSVIIALPRQGGVYWPENVDERATYPDAWSMRLIVRSSSPLGSTQVSHDYVFTISKKGDIVLQEKRPLMILE